MLWGSFGLIKNRSPCQLCTGPSPVCGRPVTNIVNSARDAVRGLGEFSFLLQLPACLARVSVTREPSAEQAPRSHCDRDHVPAAVKGAWLRRASGAPDCATAVGSCSAQRGREAASGLAGMEWDRTRPLPEAWWKAGSKGPWGGARSCSAAGRGRGGVGSCRAAAPQALIRQPLSALGPLFAIVVAVSVRSLEGAPVLTSRNE